MADISQVTVKGTAYNIKDATSRSKLATIETALGDISAYDGGDGGRATISEVLPPAVTTADNGKVLKVIGGAWAAGTDNAGTGGLSVSVSGETLVIG